MSETEDSPHVRLKVPSKTLLMAVWAACIGGTFQYGYNVSIINAPTKAVQEFINETWLERYGDEIPEQLLTFLWSSIVSIFTIGGLIGASVGGTLAIRFGRKGTLLFNNSFALLAALLMGMSYYASAFELLILGRFLSGVNAGVAICVQPLYLGEIAPRALRGAMAMGTSIFITGGILTGQVMGLTELLGKGDYWPLLLSTTCIPALLQLLILPWFPESPRYLLIDRSDDHACSLALKQLHGGENYHGEREDMERERASATGVKPLKPWELFADKNLRWPLFAIIIISTAQQLNGINAIYFYAEYVFAEAGIPFEKIPYATVGTGACECITALTCGLLIDSLGRRVLIIGGYSLMSLWCICFTITLTFQTYSSWMPYLSMACVFAFILSFGLGPGGVTNILITELFTQTARPAAYMIGGSVNWLSFFFIGMVFPFIVNGLQQYCFLVFLVVCCLVATFIFFVVPETKNKTFLEIQNEFLSRKRTKLTATKGSDPLLSTSL
ncbi:solute carrier family 2, facilitated glucose transporter member 11-like isoform X2 [Colossoma macropomum]|uniref:solute carrier family 2, facilitated glucose transporter member 11-like isoform X2 n=1 Tax=Colossoma macropomum TaxID=42526 RepID=UPI001864B31B|nr:solute carrier family 2, facilitated glucose transporter member 11-like isoform X2 [Colossoma macropomum]